MNSTILMAPSSITMGAIQEHYNLSQTAALRLDEPCGALPARGKELVNRIVMNMMPYASTEEEEKIVSVYAYSPAMRIWSCFPGSAAVDMHQDGLRSACACRFEELLDVPAALRKGVIGSLSVIILTLALPTAADMLSVSKRRCEKQEPNQKFGFFKKAKTLFSAFLQLADEITDIRVLFTYFHAGWWGFFSVALFVLTVSSLACMCFASLEVPMRPAKGDTVLITDRNHASYERTGKVLKREGSTYHVQIGGQPGLLPPAPASRPAFWRNFGGWPRRDFAQCTCSARTLCRWLPVSILLGAFTWCYFVFTFDILTELMAGPEHDLGVSRTITFNCIFSFAMI